MKKTLFVLSLVFLFIISCGKNQDVEAEHGIDEALSLLSKDECDKAISVLSGLKGQEENPIYLKTLASAYACKASFDMIYFLSSDLPNINHSKLLSSLSILSTSEEESADSASYKSMRKALEILGGSEFTQTDRNSRFGKRHAEDMGVQFLSYSIVALGKYLNWYGNVNSSGKKGMGGQTNKCYLDYSYPQAASVVSALPATNSCNSSFQGNSDLNNNRRICEGITLMSGVYDVLRTLDLRSSVLLPLAEILVIIEQYKSALDVAGVGHLMQLTSPRKCEVLLENSTERNNAQMFFALAIETGHE